MFVGGCTLVCGVGVEGFVCVWEGVWMCSVFVLFW